MSREVLLQVPIDVARVINDILSIEPVYIVGGFVRDLMLHVVNDDIDIAVRDLDKVAQRLKSLGYSLSEEARSFRVVKVMLPGARHVDVAGFRSETYDLKSRKPVVRPANDIIEDSARRDFTINAMSIIVKHVNTDDLLPALQGGAPRGLEGYTPFYGCYSVVIHDEGKRLLYD
jgi:tRNA nucleotidyltransferase/poly(A) polymerase